MDARINNFDLIRLFAAAQVVIVHGVDHLGVRGVDRFIDLISYFPGVPIFFTISGFLISKSWERSPDYKSYFRNRLLRIYPALWVCLFFTITIFITSGVRFDFGEFAAWLAAQLTFFQFYNPEFLRTFGVGVMNGSLWTIPVELQFYFLLPFLYLLCKQEYETMVNSPDGGLLDPFGYKISYPAE